MENQKEQAVLDNAYIRKGIVGIFVLALLIAGVVLSRPMFLVANVNGMNITRSSYVSELERQGGEYVLEGLILDVLVMQEASENGVTVSAVDVNEKIDEIKGSVEAQGMTFSGYLAQEGITEEYLRDRVHLQLLMDGILEQRVDITEEDVDAYIAANEGSFEEGADISSPEFREGIRDFLVDQEKSFHAESLLSELKEEADIVYYR